MPEFGVDGYEILYPYFTAKTINRIDNGAGYWSHLEVGVFQHDSKDADPKMIGSYVRNYSTLYNTFEYIRRGDRHFALFSPDYTGTRVMEIFPNVGIKDIGGEDRNASGFCPVDLYVPTLRTFVREVDCGPQAAVKDWSRLLDFFPPGSIIINREQQEDRKKLRYDDGQCIRAYTGKVEKIGNDKHPTYCWVWGPKQMYETCFIHTPSNDGFIAGCVWGDDSSWKIQHLDLTGIEQGQIKRTELFGYVELANGTKLKDAINTDFLEDGGSRITMSVQLTFDLATGNFLDWGGDITEKFNAGRLQLQEHDKQYRKQFVDNTPELQRRWAEQGERITAEVLAAGGELR